MKNKKYTHYSIIILLSIVSLGIIFNNLGSSMLFDWDESHYGEVALEILKTGDWVVLKYGGQPDLIAKPPLGAWLIAISFKMFGITEFALRFWSALFGAGTIILVYFFGVEMENKCVGIYSSIFLLTTGGFIGYHGARTGDYDVILTFFSTLSLYFFYMSQKREKRIFLIGAAVAIALAVLVKGIVGLFPAVIMGIYLLYFKSLKKTFLTKETGYAAFSFSLLVLPWFIYRSIRGKDYFSTVFDYDLLKRFSEPVEGHVGDWSFYFVVFQEVYGKIIFILIIVAFIYSMYLVYRRDKTASILVVWITLFMAVFTVAKTKIFWYILPLYPAVSLLVAYNLDTLQKSVRVKKELFILMFLVMMIVPFLSIIQLTQAVYFDSYEKSVRDLKGELSEINVLYIHSDENRQSIFLYLNSYVKDKVNVYDDINSINANKGDGIITFNSDRYNFLANNPDYKLVKVKKYVALFKKI